jgi:hypothetical protein
MRRPPLVKVQLGVADVESATPSSVKSQAYPVTAESGRDPTSALNVTGSPAIAVPDVTRQWTLTPFPGSGGGGGGGGGAGAGGVGAGGGDGPGVGPGGFVGGSGPVGSTTRTAADVMSSPAVAVTVPELVLVHSTCA